jgi:hypothetical protein
VIPVEVTQAPWHATGFWDWVDHWQTLIAGVLAFVAGVGTVVVAMRVIAATREQTATTVRLERERASTEVDMLRKSLAVEIRLYIETLITTREILRQRSGPEKHMRARDLRSVVAFHPPTVYPASADRIGLLGPLAVSVVSFYSAIERLNFTVRFLTNDPEELVASRESIEKVTSGLEKACGTTLPWLSELSFDERDADFKAKIAKWDAERPPERAP